MKKLLGALLAAALLLGVYVYSQKNQPPERILVDTTYYRLALPADWNNHCFYAVTQGEGEGYSLSFYNTKSYEAGDGGFLFAIQLLNWMEDYIQFPSYDLLGSVSVPEAGSYNVVITYPTDVQFSDETAGEYQAQEQAIPDIIASLSFKENCTFSPTPLQNDW